MTIRRSRQLWARAGTSRAAPDTGTFYFQEPVVAAVDFTDTCLGPGAVGTLTGTATGVGRYTENGPPTFAFHSPGTLTTDFRIDYVDGRSAVGTLLDHTSFSGNGAVDHDHHFRQSRAARDVGVGAGVS